LITIKKEQDDLKLVKELHDVHHVHCVDRYKICKTEHYGNCGKICSLCFVKNDACGISINRWWIIV